MTLFVGQAGGLVGSWKRQRASQVAGFIAAMIAAAALAGWLAGLPLLMSWGPGFPAMSVSGSLCLAILGLALMHPGRRGRFAAAAGIAVTLLCAFALGLLFLNVNIGDVAIDQVAPPYPGMAALGLTGAALALSFRGRHRTIATALAGIAGGMAVFTLLGYLAGVDPLYVAASLVSLPLPVAAALLCLAIGIILRIGATPALRTAQPLWRLLIALGCAIIAPLVLFGAYAGTRVADAQLNQVRDGLTGSTRTLAEEIDREIIGEIRELQALAISPSLRSGDFAAFQQQAEASLAYRRGVNIMLVDRDMQQLVNTWVPFGAPLEKAVLPESAKQTLATGQPNISSLFTGSAADQLVLGISVPVLIDGQNRYVLVRPVDQGALAGLVVARRQQLGLDVAISDATGRIIARSEQQEPAFTGNMLLAAQGHCPGPGGIFTFVDAAGRPSLAAYTCSDLTGWQTTAWEPKALLEAPVLALWRTLSWLALMAFTLVAVTALWLGRIIARSVGHAAHAATALGEGNPLPLSGTPVAEINTLMAELRSAAARRQAAERDLQISRDQLQASKDQLQLAFDAALLGWWQSDPYRATVSGDARFREIFEVTAGEVSVEDIVARLHPDDIEAFRADRAAALDPANPKPIAHEYRIRRQNGEVRWLQSNALAHFIGTGPARRVASFGGTVQDITERKESEEKEHLLMREINHRAKNMLSVVDAIAHQTATRSPEDFVERFSKRVQALSANQDLLVRNEWKGVEIADLARAQLAHFADLIGTRIAMQGPRLRLNPASAQAIGLALHELATNAGKYGALSTGRGQVDISWGITGGDTFTMSWTEREGPLVVPPSRRGFGTVVMEAMAKRSVDGAVQLDYLPSGVSWRLTCPAANVIETAWMTTGFATAPLHSHDAPA